MFQTITTDMHIHVKQFYNKFNKGKDNRKRILKIIDQDILEFAESIKCLAEKELNRQYSERFVYALSLHLSAFFKRTKEKTYNNRTYIENSIQKDDPEFQVALQIQAIIRNTFCVEVPEMEVTYLALLLKSVQEERSGQVGILVVAHGDTTASSMVNVVEKLLGEANVCAVDMPLDVSPRDILEIIITKVQEMDKGKGVLLLVDMGSLFNFETTVVERTGRKVRTIDMVSTPLVLEAVRKSSVFNMELDEIYRSLAEFRGYQHGFKKRNHGNKVIVTVCSSGKGSAVRLQELVEKIIGQETEQDIPIIPTGIRELDQTIKELQKDHEVLAVVGVKRPKENLVFIPLEKLIDGSGERMLQELVAGRQVSALSPSQSTVAYELCEDNLKQFLVYLNPHKVVGVLLNFVQELAGDLDMEVDNSLRIRLVLHLGYALERMITGEGLEHKGDKTEYSPRIVSAVHHGCELFERSLHISLTEDEQYYICDMVM